MNRQGASTQSLRSMPGNFFGSQPANARNQPMVNQRIPNGKIGGSGWGTGMPLGGAAPGFSNPPSRTNTLPNFAQAIGGGASSQASLDLSEFPSLSGGPQAQNQNQMSQAWNSNALRQTQTPSQSNVPRSGAPGDAPRQQPPGGFGFGAGMDDAFEGRSNAQSRADSNPNRLTGGDDFPPLGGGMNGDGAHSRPGGLPQDPSLGGGAFGGQVNGQLDGDSFGAVGVDGMRSPLDSHRTPSNPSLLNQQLFSNSRQAPIGQPNAAQQAQQGPDFGSQMIESPSAQQPVQPRRRLSELSESDKWGLPGLLTLLPGRTDGSTGIVMGQDLNSLGIDFDSTSPLFPTLATPFADANARPAIPDIALPAAYGVGNVPPLHQRIGNFSDETLFAIFYQYTRDVMQEVAAAELYTRDWRWHKQLRQWMMKDASMSQPLRTSERSERGVYVFFDAMNWRRERREFDLNYDHLDQRHGTAQAVPTQ